MTTFSDNEAIEYLDGLAGKDISVRGSFVLFRERLFVSHSGGSRAAKPELTPDLDHPKAKRFTETGRT